MKHLIQGLDNKPYVRVEAETIFDDGRPGDNAWRQRWSSWRKLHPQRHAHIIWTLHRYDYRATKSRLRTIRKSSFRVIFQKAFNALF